MNRSQIEQSPWTRIFFVGMGAALLAAGLAAASARADGRVETATATVQLADLNLNRHADVLNAYRRLQRAAEVACGPSTVTGSRIPLRDYKECTTAAVDHAVRKLDRPELTAYHLARVGVALTRQTANTTPQH